MSKITRTVLFLTLAALAVIVSAFAMRRAMTSAASERTPQAVAVSAKPAANSNAPVVRFVKNPEAAPFFRGKELSGKIISNEDFKGKVLILNFWATWCGPCREEVPEMVKLQTEFKDKLQVVGASEDEDDDALKNVTEFAKRMGMNYPTMFATNALIDAYGGIPALPTSFVIDRQGRVVQKHTGLYPIESYEREIRSLLDMPTDAQVETFADTGQIFLKNAANATELPGVSFAGLTPEQKKIALRRLNTEMCTCGCGLTLAECRINDESCPISGGPDGLAQKVVNEVKKKSPPGTGPASATTAGPAAKSGTASPAAPSSPTPSSSTPSPSAVTPSPSPSAPSRRTSPDASPFPDHPLGQSAGPLGF